MQDGKTLQIFDVQLTELQRRLLTLLGVSEDAFRLPSCAATDLKTYIPQVEEAI
jgi:hypothetical protein